MAKSYLSEKRTMPEKILGLRTVIYFVPDLEAAKKWYVDAFGVKPYYDTPYYVGINVGGYELGLHPEGDEVKKRSDNAVTYWGVDDVESAFKDFISKGAKAHEKPNNVGGEIVVASVKDPWGNVIGLIYNPDFKLKE